MAVLLQRAGSVPPRLRTEQRTGVTARFEVLDALAEAMEKHFPCVEITLHHTLQDIRPFLWRGWRAQVGYHHVWRIDKPDNVWRSMNDRKRRAVKCAQDNLAAGIESGQDVVDEFMPLLHQTVSRHGARPSAAWEAVFRERLQWMWARDICRLYTLHGTADILVGALLAVLSRQDATACLWQICYDPACLKLGVSPALYWAAAQDLCSEFSIINFEGGSPTVSRFKDSLGTQLLLSFRLASPASYLRLWCLERGRDLKRMVFQKLLSAKRGLGSEL